MRSRPELPRWIPLAVVGAVQALLMAGCMGREADKQPHTAFVRKVFEIPGEEEILHMEDDRWTYDGKLKKFLTHPNPKVRRRAALALGRIRDPAMAADMKAILADKDKEVRAAAAFAAGLYGDRSLAPDVEALLDDPVPAVKAAAVAGRALLGGTFPEKMKALLSVAAADKTLAGEACLAAGHIGTPPTIFSSTPSITYTLPAINHPPPPCYF